MAVDGESDAVTPCNDDQTSVDVADDGNKAPRLPRWTRQEILVLIQGKKVAENRVRRSRIVGSAFGSNQLEPKWNSVSSYCKRHGVNRGPVQCRKRWSNLAGDFRKIKEWESRISGSAESFWVMRNDLRRERKLPGFFDREVFDILERGEAIAMVTAGMTVTVTADAKDNRGGVISVKEEMEDEEEGEEEEAVFDSGRSAAADDGLFSDFEQSGQERVERGSPTMTEPSPLPVSEKQYQPISEGYLDQGMASQKKQTSNPEKGSTSREGQKRRRLLSDEGEGVGVDATLQDHLIKVLERNSRMLTAQLEAQNINCELDRDQRKDYTNNLVVVLSKLADTLGRIADKL